MLNYLLRDKGALTLTVVFFVAGLWLVSYHEMWRDELQAWLLARDSSSVIVLFENLKYEGHPGLWHLLLMPLTRIFQSPVSMQYLNLVIAAASVYLLARHSPFTWLQKVLIAFGYYFFYEYGIIARNYAIGVLLVFLYCAIFQSRRKQPLAIATTLFLLAHTSVLGLIIAFALFSGLIIEEYLTRSESERTSGHKIREWFGILIVMFGFVSAVVQLKPPADSGYATAWTFHYSYEQIVATLGALVDACFPLPKIEVAYWKGKLPIGGVFSDFVAPIIALGVFFAFARSLFGRPSAAFIYICSTIGLLAFFYTKYMGYWRHHGFVFVALIAALWIAPSCNEYASTWFNRKPPALSDIALDRLFVFILLVHVAGVAIAAYQDYKYPFSGAKDAARFIREHELEKLEIIGDCSPQASAVAGYLSPRLFYYPDAARYGSFVRWDNKISVAKQSELLNKAAEIAMHQPEGILLVLNYPIESSDARHVNLNLLYISESPFVGDEKFYIYRFKAGTVGLPGREN